MTEYASQVWALDDTATAWTIDSDGNYDAAPIYGPPRANQLAGPWLTWVQSDLTLRDGATATLDVYDTLSTISGFNITATRADFDADGNLYVITDQTTLPPGTNNRSVHQWDGAAWNMLTLSIPATATHLDAVRSGFLLLTGPGSTTPAMWLDLSDNSISTAWAPQTSSGGPMMNGVVNSAVWNGTDGLALFVPAAADRPTYAGIYAFDSAGATSSGPHQLGYSWASTAITYPQPVTMVRDQLDGHWLVVATASGVFEVVRFDKAGLTVTDGPYNVEGGGAFIDAIAVHGSPMLGPPGEEPTAGGIFLARGVLGSATGLVLG